MRKHIYRSLVIAAALALTGSVAVAEETNILHFKTAGVETVLNAEKTPEEYREKLKISDAELFSVETVEETVDEKEDLWGYTNLGIAHVDNHLNVREEPNENGKLVGKMSKNTACEILEEKDGWAHIKSGKVEGYVSLDYLYTGEEAEAKAKEVVTTIATVNTTTLKVRGEPNTDSIVLTLVPIEEELEVVNLLDGWAEIMLDDEQAYVSLEYVDVEEKLETAVSMKELMYGQGVSNTRVDLVQFAKKYVGNPYVWGGVSLTNGADCSGFVLSVYKQFGVTLPHSSRAQAGYGTKINASEAQPGDLFFYAKNGTINHVAIYIGNGQVVHASSPRTGIKISNAYYRTPATVRRILP
ncbi:MAG: SH3 domain-containing protein [Clostridiales bacterium]|nr:SH3 domain-containing protein [Clostridiales bacterium]